MGPFFSNSVRKFVIFIKIRVEKEPIKTVQGSFNDNTSPQVISMKKNVESKLSSELCNSFL